MKKWMLGVAVAAAMGAASVVAIAENPMSTAVARDEWQVKGLSAPAELIVDHWGIPHIFAASQRDAFFLQGYNAARDRLWQIDLWRKRGLGLLSKSFGPAYVEQDRAARLFLYRGDMQAEWNAYAPDARASVEAFAAGINAYVAEVRAGGRPTPVEFRLTSSTPDEWKPEDILRIRSHALVSNVTSEVARARVACAAGVDACLYAASVPRAAARVKRCRYSPGGTPLRPATPHRGTPRPGSRALREAVRGRRVLGCAVRREDGRLLGARRLHVLPRLPASFP